MNNNASKPRLTKGVKFLLMVLAALFVTFLVALWMGVGFAATAIENVHALCDACFLVGTVYFSIGALTAISTTGFFDIFGYGFKSIKAMFTFAKRGEEYMSYYDYKLERAEKRAPLTWHVLLTGVILLALSGLLLFIYHQL